MKPSLQTSLLRRNQGKQQKFRKERSWFKRLKQRVLIFLLVVGAGYTVFWLQTRKPFKQPDKDSAEQVKQFDAAAILAHKDDLPTKDLISLAGKMDLDTNAPLPVQIEWIENRMEVSDQLLAKPNDEVASKEGTLYRLEALQLLSNLNRKFELGNDTVEAQLYELCEANLSHSDPEVSKIAAVAIMMTSMHQFSNEPTGVNLKDAIAKCNQIASQLNDDHEIALAVFKYARLMKRANSMVDDSVQFFRVVIEQYLHSENAKAKGVAHNAFRELLFGDSSGEPKFASLLIAGISDRFRSKRETVESELENRIQFTLLKELADENMVSQQLEMLEVLFANQRIAKALSLSEILKQFYATVDNEDLVALANSTFEDFQKRIGAFGKYLDVGQLEFVAKTDVSKGRKPTLLVFWSPENQRANRLLNVLKNLSADEIAQCIVVACDVPDDEQVKKLAKEIPNFKFTIVDSKSSIGLPLIFPVPKVPYLVLLDRDWNVAGINPHPRDIGERILNLIEN